jgi:peroxidase
MSFWLDLVRQCKPFKDNGEYHVPLDDASVEVFDNSYYKGLLQARGLLASDEAILNDSATRSLVLQYASSQELFFDGFRKSMAKMSSINVLTGNEGEIRINCSLQNSRLLIK